MVTSEVVSRIDRKKTFVFEKNLMFNSNKVRQFVFLFYGNDCAEGLNYHSIISAILSQFL